MIKPIATRHHERHRSEHIGWLRAAVLGANDGLISTSSLLVGVAAAAASPQTILMTGVAALVKRLVSLGIDFTALDVRQSSLEDIFVDLVGERA